MTANEKRVRNGAASLTPYFFTFPAGILIFVFVVIPFLLNIAISFTNYSFINPNYSFVSFENYKNVLGNSEIWEVARHTLVFTLGSLILSTVLGLIAALIMTSKIVGVNILKATILLPWILPETVTGYVWQWMFTDQFGIIPVYLHKLGLIGDDFSFFTSGPAAMATVIIANSWRAFPFIAVNIFAKLRTLPEEMLEAARMDGANAFQTFFYIKLGWIMPILQRCVILVFIWTFNAFAILFTMTNGRPAGQTSTLPLWLQRLAFTEYNFGQATALGVLILLFIIAVFCLIALIKFLVRDKSFIKRRTS
jgi:multiple sugar transport system permease protein